MAHLKGQNVNLLLDIYGNTPQQPIAASSSCTFNINANTADASAKDDPGLGEWDNPEFTNYSWSMSNESFLIDISYLHTLLYKIINGNLSVAVAFQHENKYGAFFAKKGTATITSLEITADNADFVKLNVSVEGNGALSNADEVTITPASEFRQRIKGKALMLSIKQGEKWLTIACSKSHKLSFSAQTSDVTDKDMNDKIVSKEATGRTLQVTTENLLELIADARDINGIGINTLYNYITNGNSVHIALGYYPMSIGQSIHDQSTGWGDPTAVLLEGDFIVSTLENNGNNKEDSTFSATFQSKGKPTVSEPVQNRVKSTASEPVSVTAEE